MIDKESIQSAADVFVRESPNNTVQPKDALSPELAGTQIFDLPLIGYSSAEDPLYREFLKPEVIGAHFFLPEKWLDGARSVISFFLPFTEPVRQSNVGGVWPSPLWLHGRFEGQKFLGLLAEHIAALIREAGHAVVIPVADKAFHGVRPENLKTGQLFSSNWSERHVAYVSGLGTFGLSKGLITEKGMAGRCISMVTDAFFEPTERNYSELYAYCTHCGKCARNCPVQAISLEHGKDHWPCAEFQEKCKEKFAPRYGCGKCQVAVPCEFQNPTRRNK
jgi:epoxyqueuosine reductase